MLKRSLSLASATFVFVAAYTQSHFQHFDQITTQQGLVNNIVNDIVQDMHGYIWIATWGGLQRYDGRNFVTYTSTDGGTSKFQSDIALRLLSDREGRLWVVTASGVGYYLHSSTFQKVWVPNKELPFLAVSSFFQDSDGIIWLCDSKKGLYFCDSPENGFRPYFDKWPTFDYDVTSLLETSDKKGFWIGSNRGLFLFDKSIAKYTPAPFANDYKDEKEFLTPILGLASDRVGGMWIRISSELIHYSRNGQYWHRDAGQLTWRPQHLLCAANGDTWSIGDGVQIFDKGRKQWREYVQFNNTRSRLPDQKYELRSMFEDRDGSLWIGSNNGIFVFTPDVDRFSYFAIPLSSSTFVDDDVDVFNATVLEKSDSQVWVGLFSNRAAGIGWFDKSLRPLPVPASLKAVCSACTSAIILFEDSRRTVWISCKRGQIGRLTQNRSSIEWATSPEINTADFHSVTEDARGNLWWATDQNTIVKWDRASDRYEETINLQFFAEFTGGTLLKIEFDKSENCLWLITTKQIIRFEENGEARFHLPPNQIDITDVNEWSSNFMLVGSEQGIFLFNKEEKGLFEGFIVEGQPFTYHVTSLATDRENNIWVGTRGNGLFKILNSRTKAIAFGDQDGVIFSSAFGGITQLKNGYLVAGVPGGLLYVDPASLQIARTQPPVIITSLTVNDIDVNLDSLGRENLNLDWNENSVGIEFSSLSYYYRGRVTYQYKLEGVDTKWQYSRGNEKIKYGELAPGTYRFRVQSQSIVSEASSDEAVVVFVIATPLWETWYFRLSAIGAVILLVVYIYYAQIQRVLLVQRIRNRISNDLHDHIGSSLSSISMLLKVVSASVTSSHASDLLKKISDTAHLTQENLHDIVWSINSKNSSMAHIVTRMQEFMYSIFEGQEVVLEFQASDSVQQEDLRLDKRYDLYLIFKELVNNGAKYAHAQKVSVRLARYQGLVELYYEDDGVGFDPQNPTNGNGLDSMRQRARNLGGKFEMITASGQGTRVWIQFPVK